MFALRGESYGWFEVSYRVVAAAAWRVRLSPLRLFAACKGARGEDVWPQFRGPDGQGRTAEAKLPLAWSETEGIKWKTPLPGRGWSSPVFAGGRIWLTTAEEHEAGEAERAEMLKAVENMPVAKQMEAVDSVRLSALEIDLATGELLQQVELFTVERPQPIHGLNSFASPTAVIADGRVVCHFGSMGTACVDAKTGEVLWRRKLEISHIVGPGSSPVVYKNLVILTCDGGDKQFITALDMATGEPVWSVNRPPIRNEDPDLRKAFSTPLLFHGAGRDQMVIPGAQWFVSYDPATGKELWRLDHGEGFSNVPAPVFDGELAYLDTGFSKPQLWAVRVDGSGDIGDDQVAWRSTQQMPTMPSPVVADGRLYVITDGGVATCLDAASGKVVWRERVPGKYSASPLLGAGRIYLCSQEGKTTVVAASEKFEKLAENQLDGKIMSSPAAVEGDLIVRSDTHLYRISGK